MKTFILDENWDICQENGNILISEGVRVQDVHDSRKSLAYTIAQKVANKIRLFTNDAYFDLAKGIDHFNFEFGQSVNINLLKKQIQEEASNVEQVKSAKVESLEVKDRILSGRILLEIENGENIYVEI